MADSTTTTYGLLKPEVGASEDTWGGKINDNLDDLDDLLSGVTALTALNITGDVGIGTSSPSANLEIASANATIQLTDTDDSGYSQIRHNSGSLIFEADKESTTASTAIRFDIDGTERMRIGAGGNVGIGTSSPSAPLHIKLNDNSELIRLECTDGDATEGPQVHIYRNSATPADNDDLGVIKFKGNNSAGAEVNMLEMGVIVQDVTAGSEDSTVRFRIQKAGAQVSALSLSSTEAVFNQNSENIDLRVESDLNTYMLFVDASEDQVKIGNSIAAGGEGGNSYLSVSAPSDIRAMDLDRATATGSQHIMNFYSNVGGTNTLVCNIEASGDIENANNRYTGFSDARLKQDIVDANSQWDDIKALQVRKYRFINHVEQMGDDASVQLGVIAQELEASGMSGLVKTKPIDESDPDGPDRKSVAYSVLYMKAVKALQEAMERIETLEAKVTALENS